MTRQIRQFTPDKRTQALHRAEEVGAARAGKEPESATYRGIRKPIHLWPTHTQVWVGRARLRRQAHLCGAHVVSNDAPLLDARLPCIQTRLDALGSHARRRIQTQCLASACHPFPGHRASCRRRSSRATRSGRVVRGFIRVQRRWRPAGSRVCTM